MATAQTAVYERTLGPEKVSTYRATASIYKLEPNQSQPRPDWSTPDEQLQKQIVENRGLWEPILVEPVTAEPGRFRIIDGHRRWFNCKQLVEVNQQTEFETVPIEVVDKDLKEIDRLKVWIFIHRQRQEWDVMVKEGVAYRLVDIIGKARAADMLGLSIRELDNLCSVYEFAKAKFPQLDQPEAAITYAREIFNLAKKFRAPEVERAIVRKVNEGRITNSKDIRKLRQILKDEKARAEFMKADGTISGALARIGGQAPTAKRGGELPSDLDAFVERFGSYPWVKVQKEYRGNKRLLSKIDQCERILRDLKKSIA